MDSFPDQSAIADALALVLEAHRRWGAGEPGAVRLDLAGAYMVNANMAGANLRGASLIGANLIDAGLIGANMAGAYMTGATLPVGIQRSTAPEPEAAPSPPSPMPPRRFISLTRTPTPQGFTVLDAIDTDGRAWWLVLGDDAAPDDWTELEPLPSREDRP